MCRLYDRIHIKNDIDSFPENKKTFEFSQVNEK